MKIGKLYLKVPYKSELWYRIKLLSDPETMDFNKGFGDDGTGCYRITQEQVEKWFENWIGIIDKFYAYIVRQDDNTFIGHVNIHFDENIGMHLIGINIESAYRGREYSEEALCLLVEHAFREMNLDKIANKFPVTRTAAERVFTKVGFIRQDDDFLVLSRSDFKPLAVMKRKNNA